MNTSTLKLSSTVLLAFTLAACGGGGGGSSPTPQGTGGGASSAASSSTSSVASSAVSSSSTSSAASSSALSSVSSTGSSSSTSAIAMNCSSLGAATIAQSSITIDSATTQFTAYGMLDVQLSAAIDPATSVVCLKDKRSNAIASDHIEGKAITLKSGNLYQVQLSRYQLPVQYELSVYHGNPVVQAKLTLAADTKSRVAFISTSKGTGDLSSWTADTTDTPFQAADAICTADANAAGLAGNYKAFLSISGQTDAVCRLQGVEGLASNSCSPAATTPEQATAPFLDMSGLPIAYGVDDTKQGLWRLPVGYDAKGKKHKFEIATTNAWTGSVTAGTATSDQCNSWSSAASDKRGTASGGVGFEIPNSTFYQNCDQSRPLLCFATPSNPWPLSQAHKRSGKLAWAQETKSNLVLADADAACTQSKPSTLANAVAWFSDASSDALCRLIGTGGKIETNCGGSSINWNVGPWVRADGYVVANTLNDLTKEISPSTDSTPGVVAPILLGADATFNKPGVLGEIVRTDTYSSGGRGATPSAACVTGSRFIAESAWTSLGDVPCSNISTVRTFVYCFEK